MADIFIAILCGLTMGKSSRTGLLSGNGWCIWWDHEIPLGKQFEEVIDKEAIRCSMCYCRLVRKFH